MEISQAKGFSNYDLKHVINISINEKMAYKNMRTNVPY